MEIVSQEDSNFELHRAEVDTAVQVRGIERERDEWTDRERERSRECVGSLKIYSAPKQER